MKVKIALTCVFLIMMAGFTHADDPAEGRNDQIDRLIARRRADRGRKAAVRGSRMAREASERQREREHQARMAPVLEAQQAALRRDYLAAEAVHAQQLRAMAAWNQAQAQQRMAAAISYEAYVAAGRRYRWP